MKFNNSNNADREKYSMFNFMCVALLLGSIWGFFEVFFKDVLSMGGTPFASSIMTGIGVFMMAIGYGLFRRAGSFFVISVFAIFTRMLIVPILGCSPMCRANAVVALLLLGASTAVAFTLFERVSKNQNKTGGIVAGGGVLFSGTAYYFAGLACAPCQYLKNFAAQGGVTTFLSVEVLWWSLFSAVLFYPGYFVGIKLQGVVSTLHEARPVPYYAALVSASIVVMCVTGLILVP
jgi:hypothetical protein